MQKKLCLFFIALWALHSYTSKAQNNNTLQPYVLIVQPIVVQSDEGTNPATMALPEKLVDRAYEKAGVDFYFLEPIFYNNTKARDGLINLDQIVVAAEKDKLLKGQGDIVNMFFVNAVDGKKGPLGRGMTGGSVTFIALGNTKDTTDSKLKYMQAFVIAHEVGHNLSLQHAVDDPNVPDSIPNIQGEGDFKDRLDPKFSLNEYQIEIVRKSPLVHPRVDLLSKELGRKAILDETFEPYFSQLQKREIAAFVKEKVPAEDNLDQAREFSREKFASAVTDFTENEKKCILFVVGEVNKILAENHISLMANHPWRFIKIESWLCGGAAHTRGTYIILSQRHLDNRMKGWSDHMTPEEKDKLVQSFGGLLVHEQMHSLQRTYKTKFADLYTHYWKFKKAIVQPEPSIVLNQLSNPDAPLAEWLIPNEKDKASFYWAKVLVKEGPEVPQMFKDFDMVLYTVNKKNGEYKVVKDASGKISNTPLMDFKTYINSFPPNDGIDHPNEISAYMFSDYFKSLISKTAPFKDASPEASNNAKGFLTWIDKEMKVQVK